MARTPVVLTMAALLAGAPARAQDQPAPPATDDADALADGFVLAPGHQATPPLVFLGYVDVGFAAAEGDGTSFPAGDVRLPADYGVDPFAPAVNTRGDVASNDPHGRFTNGFLPRSVGIGGRPSFLLNTAAFAMRYQPAAAPVMAFARVHLLPRFGGDGHGDATSIWVEQAFGRLAPLPDHEVFVSVGKFDPVFGIEYLETQSPFRTGVTPSLLARYTSGTVLGVKAFARAQIAPVWSALSLNAAATNAPPFVEALQPADASLTGAPVVSTRAGYELNLPGAQLRLGASGLRGPRNDQRDRGATMTMWGADARLTVLGLSLAGEFVHVDEDAGAAPKQTGMGDAALSSEFHARGFWAQAAYAFRLDLGAFRVLTPYGRYERRRAWFEGFRTMLVDRVTVGMRADFWDVLAVKVEALLNGEIEGAPPVDNDVFTSSVVFSW